YDDDVLYAAAWLHDLGVFIGHRPEDPAELARWDNVAYAVASVPAILGRLGFPAARVAAVQSAIQHHLPAAAPPTIEGAILRDADILEQLGAVGILRTVSKVGRDTRFHTFGDALAALERNLASLPGQLRLPAARRLAQARIAALAAFLAAARAEGAE
ncbi:MAG TPA: HD domain-containing protein, partial [Herpetosiphonaceae bacterium]|nr:HD domain-containing protein [Herpetosiphonaceae bacterium]